MEIVMKKLLIAAAALLTVAAPVAASAAPFGFDAGRGAEVVRIHDDGSRGGGFRGGYGPNWDGRYSDGRGAAVAAGLFGFVLGAALDHPYYAQPQCGWVTQAYPGPYGGVRYEQVQVCR
jgi:hypothetical protein